MTACKEHQRLYILSFDHRGSFKKGLMGITGEPSSEERERISELKALIYDGFKSAIDNGAPRHSWGCSSTRSSAPRSPAQPGQRT